MTDLSDMYSRPQSGTSSRSSLRDKFARLKIHHRKEAAVYDELHIWNDIAYITAESVAGIELHRDITTILDVATGTGRVAEYFKGKVKTVVGCDISEDMLQVAQAEGRVDIAVLAPGEQLPFLSSAFDLIYCRSALHYMDYERALREWVRVAKGGGWVISVDLSFEREVVNRWFDTVWKLAFPEMSVVSHRDVANVLGDLGQTQIDFQMHKVSSSLNDFLARKGTNKRNQDKIKNMFATASSEIKKELNIRKVGTDYISDVELAVTRCRVQK